MGGSGVVLLLVRLHALPERLILGLSFFGLLLLFLNDGRCFGGGSGGFRRLMPLVSERTTNRRARREAGEQDFRVERFQHRGLRLGEIGVPGASFMGGAGLVA